MLIAKPGSVEHIAKSRLHIGSMLAIRCQLPSLFLERHGKRDDIVPNHPVGGGPEISKALF
jgi:hypothetical protein